MIVIRNFKGMAPRVNPKLLPLGFGQKAKNVDLRSGTLRPIKGLSQVLPIGREGTIKTIYKMDDYWLTWNDVVDVVKANIIDGNHRIFFTGDGAYPKQTDKTLATSGEDPATYPTATRRYGVVAPTTPLTIQVHGEGSGIVTDSVGYVYTYVTEWGEESAPSPTTVVVDVEEGQYLSVTGITVPSLAATGNDIKYVRIYRIASGSSNAEYQLAKMRPAAYSATAVYDVPVSSILTSETELFDCDSSSGPSALNDELAEVLPTEEWDCPPATLAGLVQFQNGIMAGFDADQLCLSEAMIPYAMPEKYRPAINGIVGLGVYSDALIVGTEDYPYVVVGNDPASVTVRMLPYSQRCLAKRGIVSTNLGVIYPSPDGLFIVDQAQGTLLTNGVYRKDQWAALTPANLISFYYDDKYFGFFEGTGKGIIFNFRENPYVQEFEIPDAAIYGGFFSAEDDKLYLIVKTTIAGEDSFNIMSWGDGAVEQPFEWESAVYDTAVVTNYGWARIAGTYTAGKTLTFKLYGDGNLIATKDVTSSEYFRLPSGYQAREWSFELEGTAEVDSVFIGHTKTQELTGYGDQ